MHTIKLLLTDYLNISVQAANLSDCRIESKKIDSVARIESNRNFFCPNWNALNNTSCLLATPAFTHRPLFVPYLPRPYSSWRWKPARTTGKRSKLFSGSRHSDSVLSVHHSVDFPTWVTVWRLVHSPWTELNWPEEVEPVIYTTRSLITLISVTTRLRIIKHSSRDEGSYYYYIYILNFIPQVV